MKSIYFIIFKGSDDIAVARRQSSDLQLQFEKLANLGPARDDETKTKFYEVDAHGDDYVDFGALSGQNGAFSWHANFPLEWKAHVNYLFLPHSTSGSGCWMSSFFQSENCYF